MLINISFFQFLFTDDIGNLFTNTSSIGHRIKTEKVLYSFSKTVHWDKTQYNGKFVCFYCRIGLFCIGFIGNSNTVCFVAVSKQLHTPTYVTIGCLAVSDLLCSYYTRSFWIFFKRVLSRCYVCNIYFFMLSFCMWY